MTIHSVSHFSVSKINILVVSFCFQLHRSCLEEAVKKPGTSMENKRIMGVRIIEHYTMPLVLVSPKIFVYDGRVVVEWLERNRNAKAHL